jgi:proline iminopeptidase
MHGMNSAVATLHSPPLPFDHGWLRVSGGHGLYYEQRGLPDGIPVLILHGGPGSGCSPKMAGFFDPGRYRVILLDQRGAGKSLPAGACDDNTTSALIEDIERLRKHLGVTRWWIMGGSWGATLGILYSAAHSAQVYGLLLRNPFLARSADMDWFFGGARTLHPDAWQHWAALGAPDRSGAMLPWLDACFQHAKPAQLKKYVTAWHVWEGALAGTSGKSLVPADIDLLQVRYRLQLHYFRHACFLSDGGVLTAASQLPRQMPIYVLQGLADHVCPASETRVLLGKMPHALCTWIESVGHDPYAPAMQTAMLRLVESFAVTE